MELRKETKNIIDELKRVAYNNGWPFGKFKIVFTLALCSNNIDNELQFFLDEAKKKTSLEEITVMIENHLNEEPD